MGFEPPVPNKKLFDSMGMPLFWQERKDTVFWGQLLDDLFAGAVFDATAGSGQLARACLERGIQYTGLAKNPLHAQILNTVLDRHALSLVGQAGSGCHDADLAALAREHFQDVTDMLRQQDLVHDAELSEEEAE